MTKTKITCPVCGAEFEIAEHTHIAVGIAIGKDSNLGEIHPTLAGEKPSESKKTNKAEQRIAALKAAGIDTSDLFAVRTASGETAVGKMQDGAISMLEDDDPIFKSIINSGTIPERRLFRRWVMSQMFHMLREENGVSEALKRKGYNYQWKMTEEELRVQARLFVNDKENFEQRNRWFNKELIIAMVSDYYKKLEKYIKQLPTKHCKGIPYKRIHGKDYFVKDIEKKIFTNLEYATAKIIDASSPSELYAAVHHFCRIRTKLNRNASMSSDWVSAYKGAGAYFTLKNMILFHGYGIYNGAVKRNKNKSLAFLEERANEYHKEGYKLFALLKKTIEDNGIDIDAKIAEWHNRK